MNDLARNKARWEIRALILGLGLSVIANMISIPGAIQQWRMGELDKKQLEIDIQELKIQKEKVRKQLNTQIVDLDAKRKELEKQLEKTDKEIKTRARVINEILRDTYEQAALAFREKLTTWTSRAQKIREDAEEKISALEKEAFALIMKELESKAIVGSIDLWAYDVDKGANRIVSKEELKGGSFSHERYEAFVNGKRIQSGDIVNGMEVVGIDKNGVTFSASHSEYPGRIKFRIVATPSWMNPYLDEVIKSKVDSQ